MLLEFLGKINVTLRVPISGWGTAKRKAQQWPGAVLPSPVLLLRKSKHPRQSSGEQATGPSSAKPLIVPEKSDFRHSTWCWHSHSRPSAQCSQRQLSLSSANIFFLLTFVSSFFPSLSLSVVYSFFPESSEESTTKNLLSQHHL